MKYLGFILSTLIVVAIFASYWDGDYKSASRESSGIAPKAESEPEALVQVYTARAFGWRKPFAVHTWIATKEKNAKSYRTYQVIGWRLMRADSALVAADELPDRKWFGAEPNILLSLKGLKAESLIPRIKILAENYPYPDLYRAWPGPNSNTFVSYILRELPELGVELSPHAIGRDWLVGNKFWSRSESGTGLQISLFGIFGFTFGMKDGIEINFLGLCWGVDFLRPALKLPLIGRMGMADA